MPGAIQVRQRSTVRKHSRRGNALSDNQSAAKKLADLNDRHDHACATGRRFKARLPPFLIQIVALQPAPKQIAATMAAWRRG
jgi:hypothetical protein